MVYPRPVVAMAEVKEEEDFSKLSLEDKLTHKVLAQYQYTHMHSNTFF